MKVLVGENRTRIFRSIIVALFIMAAVIFVFFNKFYAKADGYVEEYSSILYDMENKLGSSEVNAVSQTGEGYIWIGTYSGLIQFDGNTFSTVDIAGGISGVMCLLPNGRDGMWIGTNNSGLYYYSFQTGTAKNFTMDNGLAANSIRSLSYGKAGELYIGTSSYLSVLSADGVLSTYNGSDDIFYINSLTCRADGTIAGVTNAGTVFFIRDGIISKTIIFDDDKENYSAVRYLTDGSLIIGTTDGRMYKGVIEGSEIKVTKYGNAEGIGCISYIYQNSEGNILLAGDNGAGYLDSKKKYHSLSTDDFYSSMSCIYEDYQQNFWIASSKQGLLKLSKNTFKDILARTDLGEHIVNSVVIKNGLYYVGCDDGLFIVSPEGGVVTTGKIIDMLKGVRVRQIYMDSKGNLWISTFGDDGLIFYNGMSIVTYSEAENGAKGNRFRSVLELSDGTIVAASTTGLTYIENGKITKTIGIDEGLEVEQILCMYEEEDGTLLAGSDGGGVYQIKDGEVVGCIDTDEGLNSFVVLRIASNGRKTFFITGDAVYYYNGKECTYLDRFPYSNNYDMIFAPDGNAWVTSGAGIFVVDMNKIMSSEEYEPELINKSVGLNTRLTANSWNYVDGEDLVLCCTTGVKRISMLDYNAGGSDFEIKIDRIDVDGESAVADSEGIFQISSEARRITFYPAIMNYSLVNPIVKMYLEGFEEEGVIVRQSELAEVSYTNLPYGEYTFHLQVLNPDSLVVIKDRRINIRIEAKLYQRFYFWIALGLVVFIIALAVVIAFIERKNTRFVKAQYDQIRVAKEEAERTSKYKTQFLANMSHEIRTPINTIMGMDELILRENVPGQVRQYANDIYSSSASLLSIVNDILDLSKIEAGKMNIVPVKYNLEELLRDLGNALRMRANEKKLRAIIEIDPNMPSVLYGDGNRIKQVIMNLLTNAVKYTDEGSVIFKMGTVSRIEDRILISVSVSDTGIGIKTEDIPKLFEEFQRFDEQRNSKIKGTGLGLSITKQLLELMGSRIEIESEYNKGSEFHFVISQTVVDKTPIGKLEFEQDNEDTIEVYKPAFQAPDAEILVVDDTPLNLAVIRGLLRANKVHVDTGDSGLVALEKVKQKHYDLILLDHMMPEMDGIETLQHLQVTQHMCPDVPIIVITANAIAGAREKYLEKGFTDYLSKPVSGQELEQILLKYLPKHLIQKIDEQNEAAPASKADSKELHYIDMNKGISFCAGDKELYESVLGMFVAEFETESKALQDCYEAKESKNYVTHAHKLKSSSRTIGADELFEKAKDLESDGKADDWDAICRKQGEVIQLYLDVVEEIKTRLLNQ